MRLGFFLILVLAAVMALTAGTYHNPGFKYWGTGTYTITVEPLSGPISEVRIIAHDNPVKVVSEPAGDTAHGTALGDTITVQPDIAMPIYLRTSYKAGQDPRPGEAGGFKIIRDGGATAVTASWR